MAVVTLADKLRPRRGRVHDWPRAAVKAAYFFGKHFSAGASPPFSRVLSPGMTRKNFRFFRSGIPLANVWNLPFTPVIGRRA